MANTRDRKEKKDVWKAVTLSLKSRLRTCAARFSKWGCACQAATVALPDMKKNLLKLWILRNGVHAVILQCRHVTYTLYLKTMHLTWSCSGGQTQALMRLLNVTRGKILGSDIYRKWEFAINAVSCLDAILRMSSYVVTYGASLL